MKNLYEQLSKKTIDAIEKEYENYPRMEIDLISQLKKCKVSSELSLHHAYILFMINYPLTIFDLTKYFELFSYEKTKTI